MEEVTETEISSFVWRDCWSCLLCYRSHHLRRSGWWHVCNLQLGRRVWKSRGSCWPGNKSYSRVHKMKKSSFDFYLLSWSLVQQWRFRGSNLRWIGYQCFQRFRQWRRYQKGRFFDRWPCRIRACRSIHGQSSSLDNPRWWMAIDSDFNFE